MSTKQCQPSLDVSTIKKVVHIMVLLFATNIHGLGRTIDSFLSFKHDLGQLAVGVGELPWSLPLE